MCKNRISVVMTTFNGEKFILSQLESIYNQTRKPDDVVICDDCSRDKTVEIIKKYLTDNKIENWTIIVNDSNIGWKENFYKATSMAKGEIIFFSDQDDIWVENKIEIMSDMMIEHKMGALYAGKKVINTEGHLMNDRQEKTHFSGKLTRIVLKPSFYEVKTLGCCMCIRKEVADLYQKVGFYEDDHDSQCGRLAVLCSSLWYLDLPVINYRIHSNNSSGISGIASFGQSTQSNRVNHIELMIKWIDKIKEILEPDEKKVALLDECKKFLIKRLGFYKNNTSFLYLLSHYKYYTGLTMILGDLAYKYNINKIVGKCLWTIKKHF